VFVRWTVEGVRRVIESADPPRRFGFSNDSPRWMRLLHNRELRAVKAYMASRGYELAEEETVVRGKRVCSELYLLVPGTPPSRVRARRVWR
jgi:hypothetical protein